MTAPDSRYRIVDESQSAHCCFGLTIVDTTKPDMVGGKQYVGRNGPQFKSVCECFEEADAKLICDALNLQALARGPQRAGGEDAVQAAARIASEAACLRIDNERLQAEVARLQRERAELIDKLNGTPCAEVRWQQERERLQAALREAGRDAFRKGWVNAAKWAQRDDLLADIGSPAYVTEREAALNGGQDDA